MPDPASASALADAAHRRTDEVVRALRRGGDRALEGPSTLPGWTRLTVACHLRYGAVASGRMTRDTLGGRPTAFYPGGRTAQRPATLAPATGEAPSGVVESLATEGAELGETWSALSPAQWERRIQEPGRPDPGDVTLAMLALLRLTETEVHGLDLDLGLADWSEVFVAHALPARLAMLGRRRADRRPVDRPVRGSWRLEAADGPTWRVAVDGDRVTSEPVHPGTPADAVILGTSRDLLALLLGRPTRSPLRRRGDPGVADGFSRAFPGP